MPAQPLPSFSPWLSRAGLMPGALPPSLRLPGPLPETHQSPMDGWCRTPLNPENRQGQLRLLLPPQLLGLGRHRSATHLGCLKPQPPSMMPQGLEEGGTRWKELGGLREECGPRKGDSSKPGVKAGPRTAAWGPGRGRNLIGAKHRKGVPGDESPLSAPPSLSCPQHCARQTQQKPSGSF